MSNQLPLNPVISIVVAVFDRAEVIQRCIDSVVSQSYPHKELIIIDGGSTDGTVEILKSNTKHITYWESKKDRGIYHAFNKGLNQAKGDWIYFLGSDDYLWTPQVLSKLAENLKNITQDKARLVYGKVAFISKTGDVLDTINQPWEQIKQRFLHECCICHQGLFHHRSFFEIHGQFDESFRISGVYEILLRELKTKNAVFLPHITVAAMQIGGLSSSPEHRLAVFKEYTRAKHKNAISVFSIKWFWQYTTIIGRSFLDKSLGNEATKYLVDVYRKLTGRNALWTKL